MFSRYATRLSNVADTLSRSPLVGRTVIWWPESAIATPARARCNYTRRPTARWHACDYRAV